MSSSSVWIAIAVLLSLFLLYNLCFVLFHEKVVFQGAELADDEVYDFKFPFEEVLLMPSSDAQLHGLLLKSDSSQGLILYFHGNRGNLARWGSIADGIRNKYRYDVLIMDYRGYGKSSGPRTEALLYQDAAFIYDYAAQLGYENIIIQGRSLGSAIATHLAANRDVSQLILETPMTRIRDVIPVLDFLLIYKPWLKYEFNSLSRVDRIKCPITIVHGTNDTIVPYELGLKMYKHISHPDKKLITINQGGHNNLDTFEAYQQAMKRILK